MQTCTNKSCIQVLVKHDSLNKFSKDHLLNYLESIWECSVKELKVAHMGNAAIICFTEAQDFTALQRTCSEKPLEEMVLEVKRTFEGGVILVSNPLPTTTDDCFMYYFKNTRRSGGDQSAKIMRRDPTHKFLLVQFSSKEVAEKILRRTHCLEDTQLELKAFDPDLDSLP